jgi:hypothetical protein
MIKEVYQVLVNVYLPDICHNSLNKKKVKKFHVAILTKKGASVQP